jgi:hypothetical protein
VTARYFEIVKLYFKMGIIIVAITDTDGFIVTSVSASLILIAFLVTLVKINPHYYYKTYNLELS